MKTKKTMQKDAVFSPCKKYRYSLTRIWDESKPLFMYVGINPSVADDKDDDPTVAKWIGFTEQNGGGGFVVGNVFAHVTTKVEGLVNVLDPVGEDNNLHLWGLAGGADIIVPCWGALNKVPKCLWREFAYIERVIGLCDVPVKCFGRTKDGDPKHPVRLPYKTKLVKHKPRVIK